MSTADALSVDPTSTSCSGACQKTVFPFSFDSCHTESDVYGSKVGSGFAVEKLLVLTREEEDPIIVDLQVDGRAVLLCLRLDSKLMTPRVDEKGMRWFTKTWVPNDTTSIVMQNHLRIRSRDLTASYPTKETWAHAALIGSFSGSCQCQQLRVERMLASQPFDYETWKVRNQAQAAVAGFRPGGMDQHDYEAWKTRCINQAIAAGFWPWDRRPIHDRSIDRDRIDDHDRIDGLTRAECRMRWWQNRCDIDAGIPLTFAMTPAQVAGAKSSLGPP